MKDVVVVSRKWNNHKIETRVITSKDGVSLAVSLDDFMKGIMEKLGSVAWVFTKAEIEKRLIEAKNEVVRDIKDESKHGV